METIQSLVLKSLLMSGSPLSRLPSILGQIDHHQRPSPLRRCGGARRRRARVAPHQAGRQVRLLSSSTCTPVRDRSGPAWLLDMAPGRSQEGPQDLARPARPGLAWAGRGGGNGQLHRFQERRWRGVPQGARAALDSYARRVTGCQQARPVPPPHPTSDTRGTKAAKVTSSTGPGATLRTEADLLTNAQARRLETLFADEHHAPVQAAWGVYHRLIQAYCTEDPGLGKYLMQHNRPLAL